MSPPQPTSLPPECVGKCSLLARERFGCLCAGLSTHLHGAPLSEPLASAPASVQLRWQRLPKIELHVHFDGAFDARCLLRVARERSCKGELTAAVARCASLAELLPLVSMAPTDEGGLPAMLAKFENLLQIVSGDLVALEELARLFVCAQAAQHVLYTEMRYSPQLLLPAGCGGGGGGGDGDGGDATGEAFRGRALSRKLLSHCERCVALAAAGRTDEALYLARSVARTCTHSTRGACLVVETLAGAGKLWEAQQV